MRTTVTSKGQITIPVELRRRFGLEAGTVLEFDEEARVLTARRVVSHEEMQKAVGVLKSELSGKSVDEWMDDLRGPTELPDPS